MATDRTERLLNLVICLLGAQRPVPRGILRESIPGYGDAASDEAFERMFERDKDELRQMGVPIETVVNAQGEVEGYRIDSDAYGMPEIVLDAAELGVLGVAARAWNEAALAAQAGTALRKIEALTGERWDAPPQVAGRPASGEEALPVLWDAIRSRRVVEFDYLPRGRDVVERRVVEPWATVHRRGAWYLVGRSRERDEGRAFRLSRVVGVIRTTPEACGVASRDDVERLVDGLADVPATGEAVVVPPPRGGAALRARARLRADGGWVLAYTDQDALVSEVLEAGGVILEPLAAAQALREAAVRVLERHSGQEPSDA